MKKRDLKEYAKEEVADGILVWARERYQDPLLDSDGKDAIHKEVIRMRKILGRETVQWWWEVK
jgi:hypothetical protein